MSTKKPAIKKYSPDEAARLRSKLLEEAFAPAMRAAFAKYPALQSAVMQVAQYWCDEAEDAVHFEVLFSRLPTPDILAANAEREVLREMERYDYDAPPKERIWHRWFPSLRPEPQRTPQQIEAQRQSLHGVNLPADLDPEILEREFCWEIPWDSNDEAIALFAGFCLEGCDQEMAPGEAYSPYAYFRRQGNVVAVEVVGEMRRPWLDGVLPSWKQDEQGG